MYEVKGKYASAKIFTKQEDSTVIEQTLDICNHPIFKDCKIRIMPDAHKGKGCVIGFTSTMPLGGEIVPNIIGVDQSCGVLVIKLKKTKTLNDYAKLDKVIKENVPIGTNVRKTYSQFVEEELKENIKKVSMDFFKVRDSNDILKIGSLGGGNHFISIEKGKSGTYLLIHSGSRNFGNKLAMHFQSLAIEKNCYKEGYLKMLSYLTGKDAEDYLCCARVCRGYAHYNRLIIAQEILENMRWKAEETFETVHNYIGNDNIIRKGAISCLNDEKVIIPLNMADGSLIAIGKGNKDWNNSAPHGAGRLLSRTQAREKLSMKEYKVKMKDIYSTCISTETLDESPMAYKDCDEIKNLITPALEILDHLIPVYNFKAQ